MSSTDDKQTKQKPKRKRRRLFIVATVLGAAVLSLVAIEGALRIYLAVRGWTPNCYAAHLSLFRPHPRLGAELAPNFRLQSGTFEISTNSLGLRGPEISLEKPPGTVRIALVGGSSVYGYLVSDGHEAARILEQQLRAEGHRVEVINAGVPGYNLFRSTVRFEERVAPLEPDVVVLYAGYNDVPYITSEDPSAEQWLVQRAAPGWERWLGHSAGYGFLAYRLSQSPTRFARVPNRGDEMTPQGQKQFRDNLNTLARKVHEAGARLVICSQATAARSEVAPELRSRLGTDEDDFQTAVRTMAWIRRELEDFAEETGARFIDVAAKIPPTADYLGDLIHLTQRGEMELGTILARHLDPMLDEWN